MKIYNEEWYRGDCESPNINKDNEEWYYNMYDTGVCFHDCFVSKVTFEQQKNLGSKKCFLELDSSGGFTAYDGIQFDDCAIVENAEICGAWILEDELYKLENGRIEYHLLLQRFTKHKDIVEKFTIRCSSIKIKNIKNEFPDIIIDKNWNGEKVHKK